MEVLEKCSPFWIRKKTKLSSQRRLISVSWTSIKKQQTIIQLFGEAKILEALDHPNIIRLREFYKTQSNNLVLILEYCQNGDLNELLENLKEEEYIQEQKLTSLLKRVDFAIVSGSQVLPRSKCFTR